MVYLSLPVNMKEESVTQLQTLPVCDLYWLDLFWE